MLAECYGLTQDPFRLSPDPKFCYRHANFAKAKAYMEYVLHQGEGFVMVTGQPGTGKTLLIADLLSDPRTAKVAKAHIRSTQVGFWGRGPQLEQVDHPVESSIGAPEADAVRSQLPRHRRRGAEPAL
jgi:hypothetical protein